LTIGKTLPERLYRTIPSGLEKQEAYQDRDKDNNKINPQH
jgi:hypothetical protein